MIDSCRLVSQSNYLNNSNKDCHYLKLCELALSENNARLTSLLEIKFGLKIHPNAWENYWNLHRKTNKEASTELCSIVKHAEEAVEHSRSRDKHSTAYRVFPTLLSSVLYRFLRALQQNRAQSRLLYLLIIVHQKFSLARAPRDRIFPS